MDIRPIELPDGFEGHIQAIEFLDRYLLLVM